jgi:hypothetical protein
LRNGTLSPQYDKLMPKRRAVIGPVSQLINSRFQRMIAKLGVTNCRMAARLAIDCGLIVK